MLDTLKLSLTDYEIGESANLDVQPSTFNAATGEIQGRYPLWRRGSGFVEGARAFHNSDDFNVTVQPFNSLEPQSIGCHVQFSVPKVATGSNYLPADFGATVSALKTIESELKSIGINTNIQTAAISRLDACRTIHPSEPYEAYHPVLQLLRGTRMAKRDYGTTFLWHNTVQQVCVYDKREEMKRHKRNVTHLPKNSVRFEHRMLKARKVRDVLGFGSVADLLVGFEQVQVGYKSALEKQLFRHSPAEVELLTTRDIENELRAFACSRYFIQDWLLARAIAQLGEDRHAFLRAVENVSTSRKTHMRMRKKIEKMEMDALSLQLVAPSKHTLGELYRELEREVLAA